MSRSNTRIQNLTRVTTLEALDIIPIGPASGDVAKGITKSDMEAQFELDVAKSYGALSNVNILAIVDPVSLGHAFSTDDFITYTFYSPNWYSTTGGILV